MLLDQSVPAGGRFDGCKNVSSFQILGIKEAVPVQRLAL